MIQLSLFVKQARTIAMRALRPFNSLVYCHELRTVEILVSRTLNVSTWCQTLIRDCIIITEKFRWNSLMHQSSSLRQILLRISFTLPFPKIFLKCSEMSLRLQSNEVLLCHEKICLCATSAVPFLKVICRLSTNGGECLVHFRISRGSTAL